MTPEEARESTDAMMARGVRVALVAYARALEDAIEQGVSTKVLVQNGIPAEDVEKVRVARGELVSCDNCWARSESGWGDTPLCLDCQQEEDPSKICDEHQRTFEGEACPLEHAEVLSSS